MDPVTTFTDAIAGATIPGCGAFADGATLDATVPMWRMRVHGAAAIEAAFAQWYADAGAFEELVRTSLPDGELLEFLLTWTERGIPFACHQIHRLTIENDLITADRVWCGGRWPASLLAEMQEAASA